MKDWKINYLTHKKQIIIDKCKTQISNNKRKTKLNVIFHPENRRILYFNTNIDILLNAVDSNNSLKFWSAFEKTRLGGELNFDIAPWNYIADVSGSIKYQPAEYLTETDIQMYSLFNEKCYAIEFILDKINTAYFSIFGENFSIQNYIYNKKAKQAELVFNNETDFLKTYYVHGWAEIRNIDLMQAAKEIAFKHENQNILIYHIDMLRIKYIKLIKQETNIENINSLCLEFQNESEIYAAI